LPKVQVMAVSTSPQVAARADQHLLISKDALTRASASPPASTRCRDHRREDRPHAAGAEITAEARAAAERLLKARRRSLTSFRGASKTRT